MWCSTIAISLLAHLSGFLVSWTEANVGYTKQHWISPQNTLLQSTAGHTFSLPWKVAMVVLLVSTTGLVSHLSWGFPLTLSGAVIALLAIVPWWNTVSHSLKGRAVFDLLVLFVLFSPFTTRLPGRVQ